MMDWVGGSEGYRSMKGVKVIGPPRELPPPPDGTILLELKGHVPEDWVVWSSFISPRIYCVHTISINGVCPFFLKF
jgi:hypothetical protein